MKIAVAMSGGVDSSVAALLLKKQGHKLIGVTLNLLGSLQDEENITSAKKICEKLQIPHHTIDIKDRFADTVIKNFYSEYAKGRTPNPCVYCNYIIKFRAIYDNMADLDIEKIATGHYVRIQFDKVSQRYNLIKGKDKNKDQSYFLWRLTQEQLRGSIFPLGKFTKENIRIIAEKNNLHTAKSKESQEVCFVNNNNLEEFLKSHIKFKPGDILDTRGKKIGRHRGCIFYTIGQRKGLGLAVGKPVYVLKIDAEKNQIIVGDNSELFKKELTASTLNWIAIQELREPIKVMAKIRYRTRPQPALVKRINDNKIKVTFDEPQRAITPGQSVVFYEEQKVVGGGIID